MTSTIVRFPATQGHELAARLEMPAGKPRAYALFAHCFTCSKDSKGAAFISQALAARGIAVLRFDFTGLGQSGGDFADSSFSSNIDDIVCAAALSRRRTMRRRRSSSATASAARRCSRRRSGSRKRARWRRSARPYDPRHVEHLIRNKEELLAKGEATVDIGGRPFHVRKRFPRRPRAARPVEDDRLAPQGAPHPALAARYDRADRQRREDLHGREAPQELRLARRRRSPAHEGRRRRLRRGSRRRVGVALSRTRSRTKSFRACASSKRARASSRRTSTPAAIDCAPTSRYRSAARTRARVPTTCCSRRSARALR